MGLDISHGAFSAPYSTFNELRNAIGVAAGYELVSVRGFSRRLIPDCGEVTFENARGEWSSPPNDPLVILLAHADCDGIIPSQYCAAIAARLGEISEDIDPDYSRMVTDLIGGLRSAANLGDDIVFS